MDKIIKFIISLLIAFSINCNFITCSYALETTSVSSNTVEIDVNDPNFDSKMQDAINDPNVDDIYTFDSSQSDTDNSNMIVEDEEHVSYARNGGYVYRYRITNVKNGSTFVDKNNLLNSYDLEPNDTFEKTYTKSLKCKYSTSVTLSTKTISTAVGFDVSEAYEESAKIKFTVPSKHDGKKVKYLTFDIYPKYRTKTFTIQRHRSMRGVGFGWHDYGSGYAR